MKSELYKIIKKKIEDEKLDLESVLYKNVDHKNIYLELLMTPDLLNYLINTTELDPFDYFYLIYKFTGKFNIKDNRILEKCKEYFKYNDLRSVISKIYKLYNFKELNLESAINTRKLKFITEKDLQYQKEFTKIGYINLRRLVNKSLSCKNNEIYCEILNLFINKSIKKEFYDHKDEEVRIQNFINDPNKNIEEFIRRNYYIESIYNIDYLIQNYKSDISDDLMKFLLSHDNENVRYLGYSLFTNNTKHLDNLLFDKSKLIRNRFVNLYKLIDLEFDEILEKKINQETLFNYLKEKDILNYKENTNFKEKTNLNYKENCKLVKLYLSEINDYDKDKDKMNIEDSKDKMNVKNKDKIDIKYKDKIDNEDSKDYKLLEYFKYKNIQKLVDILIKETDLKYILRIEKYLSELFINSDSYDYPFLIEKTFKQVPFVNIRKSGGLSVICKCILKNKNRRKENLELICKYLEIKTEGFMKNIHIFNIFIEIYRKYQIISDSEGIKVVLRNIDKEDFIVKNMCIKMFEIIYKRKSVLNLEYLDTTNFKDDSLFLFLCLSDSNKIKNIHYEGNNLLVKCKLDELES